MSAPSPVGEKATARHADTRHWPIAASPGRAAGRGARLPRDPPGSGLPLCGPMRTPQRHPTQSQQPCGGPGREPGFLGLEASDSRAEPLSHESSRTRSAHTWAEDKERDTAGAPSLLTHSHPHRGPGDTPRWGTHYGAVDGVQVVGDRLPRPGHRAFQGRELHNAHDGADVCAQRETLRAPPAPRG